MIADGHGQPRDPRARLARAQREHERDRAESGDQDLLPWATRRDALDEEQQHERDEEQPVAFPELARAPLLAGLFLGGSGSAGDHERSFRQWDRSVIVPTG